MADSPVLVRVTTLVSPILTDLGLDLYDVDFGAGLLKITVDKPGAYVYKCTPHMTTGMVGTIVVGDDVEKCADMVRNAAR